MAIELVIPRMMTKRDEVQAKLDPGRKRGKPVGTYMSDLVAMRKIVLLCPSCQVPFDKEYWNHGYRREDMLCVSKCDACRKPGDNIRTYVPEENWRVAHAYDDTKPRKGRWGLPPHMTKHRFVHDAVQLGRWVFTKE